MAECYALFFTIGSSLDNGVAARFSQHIGQISAIDRINAVS
jgi:hypothetical protein